MSDAASYERGLDLATFAPYRIAVIARAISQQLGAAYECEDLTIPEWRVLAVVSQAAAVAARDVVARTPMDKMAVSRAVASLEAKDLIRREKAEDRRVAMLKLSPKGRDVFERVARIALNYEQRLLAAMTAEDRTKFFQGLSMLEAAVSAGADKSTRAAE